jgi:hypothetical protein
MAAKQSNRRRARRLGRFIGSALFGLMLAGAADAHQSNPEPPGGASGTGQHMMGGQQGGSMGGGAGADMPMMPGMHRLMMPEMNSARGRKLFASKGCVAWHSVNGVGGHDATSLDAHSMMRVMNPFDFAAKMWSMAPAMIYSQEEALGGQILFTGDELADIIAFVHDDEEQHRFSESDIPPEVQKMMHHGHGSAGGGAGAHGEDPGHGHGESEAGDEPHHD